MVDLGPLSGHSGPRLITVHQAHSTVQTPSEAGIIYTLEPTAIHAHSGVLILMAKTLEEKILMAFDIKIVRFPLVTCCEAKYGQQSRRRGSREELALSGLLQFICTPHPHSSLPSCRSLAHTQPSGTRASVSSRIWDTRGLRTAQHPANTDWGRN